MLLSRLLSLILDEAHVQSSQRAASTGPLVLFSVFTLVLEQKISDLISYNTNIITFYRKYIKDKHKKLANVFSVGAVKPKFYTQTMVYAKILQELKLDGLAWNLILCTPDKL